MEEIVSIKKSVYGV